MDEENQYFDHNLRRYNLLQLKAYNLLTSCEKPEDGYRSLQRKYVYSQKNGQIDRYKDG